MKKLISLLLLTLILTFMTDPAQAKWRVKPAPQAKPAPQIKSASSQQDADTELAKIMQNPTEFSFSMIQGIPNSFNLRFLSQFWDLKARNFGPHDLLILTSPNLTPDKISGLDLIAQGGAQFCKIKKNLTIPGTTNLESEVCGENQQASQTTSGGSVSDSVFGSFDLYSTAGCKGDGSTGLVASMSTLGSGQKNNSYNLSLKGPNSCGGDAGNLNASSGNGNRFHETVGNLQDKLCSRSAGQAARGEEGFVDKKPAEEGLESKLGSLMKDRASAIVQTNEGWKSVIEQIDSSGLDAGTKKAMTASVKMMKEMDLALIDVVVDQEEGGKCEGCGGEVKEAPKQEAKQPNADAPIKESKQNAEAAKKWEQLIQEAIEKGTEKAKKVKKAAKKTGGTHTSSNDSDTPEEPSNTVTPCDKNDASGMCGGRSHFADSLIRSLRTGKTLEDIENQRINPVRGGTQAGEEFPRINVCESIDTVDSLMTQKGFGGDTKQPGDDQKKFNRTDQKKFNEQLKRGQALPKNNPRVINPIPPGP